MLRHLHHSHRDVTVGRKFTTRPRRPNDSDWEFQFVSRVPTESVAFRSVGHDYGIDITELDRCCKSGRPYVVTCGDLGTIHRLKSSGFELLIVYVFRPLTAAQLDDLFDERATASGDAATRREEVARTAQDYVSKFMEIDRVLLNVGSVRHLHAQVDQLVRLLVD